MHAVARIPRDAPRYALSIRSRCIVLRYLIFISIGPEFLPEEETEAIWSEKRKGKWEAKREKIERGKKTRFRPFLGSDTILELNDRRSCIAVISEIEFR